MPLTLSRLLTALVALVALTTFTQPLFAEPAADQSQPAMAGCPGKADGSPCCATCQDRAARAAAGEADTAAPAKECPCQRARRLKEKAAALRQQQE